MSKERNAYAQMVFFSLLDSVGIPRPIAEYKFHPVKGWRFDYAWPDQMIALEVEGGIWTNGRHSRGSGMKKDMEKYNAAAINGWRMLRVVPTELSSTNTIKMLQQILITY